MKSTFPSTSCLLVFFLNASLCAPCLLQAQINVGGNGSNTTDSTFYTGNQSLTKLGSNTVTLTRAVANDYSGGTFVNEGTLATQGPNASTSTLGTGNITINNGGTIRVESSNAMGFASDRTLTINSGGVLTNNGTASQQLNAVLLNGGTIAGSASAGDAAIYGSYAIPYGVATGGSSDTSVISAPNIVLTQQGGTVFNIASGATNGIDLLVSGFIAVPSGAVGFTTGLIKQGQGVMVLAGNNTYTEGTTIAAGTLRLSGSNASSTYGIAAGAVLDINQTNTGALQTFSGGTYTGSGTLRKTGAGVFTWRDAAAINLDSSAVVDVQEGTLQASFAANQIWANNQSSLNVASGAVFDVDAAAARFGGLTGSGTVRLGLAGSFPLQKLTIGVADASSTFGGSIVNGSSSAPLEKVGTGTITLTGTNTYTGTTTISGGILQIGNGGTSGTLGAGAVTNHAMLVFNRSDHRTIGNVISGTGSVVIEGTGITTLNAANTFTGATRVNAGTLAIGANGSIAASSEVILAAGSVLNVSGHESGYTFGAEQTLSGGGTIVGDAIISGTHSPGFSPGIQAFDSNLTYTVGSNVIWELIDNTIAGRGTNYDGIDVGGDLTFTGATTITLDFALLESSVAWSDSFWNIDYLGTDGWKIFDVAGTISGFENLTLGGSLLDINELALGAARSGASFFLYEGNDGIYLNYAAIPEPTVPLLGGLTTLLLLRRKRD